MLTQPMAQRIELWRVEKLIPYARNLRTHSDAQVAQIAASIAEFGFNNPILVDTKDGIIAGPRPPARRAEIAAYRSASNRSRPPQKSAEARICRPRWR